MSLEFIDSDIVKIDGETLIYFRDSSALLKGAQEVLTKIGPEKFFSSPADYAKKAKESMPGAFFLLELQSLTSDFLFLMQPQKDPPDFIMMKIGSTIETMRLDPFELVEVPTRCESFEEMLAIVQKKIDKGYTEKYNLLIFVNNENSKEWLPLLNQKLVNYDPFLSVWTVHLLVDKNNGNYMPIVNKLRPLPIVHIDTKIENIKFPTNTPYFTQEIIREGKKFLGFKQEFVAEFLKKLRKIKLKK